MPTPDAIRWRDDHLELLDQRHLPNQCEYLTCRTAADVADAITTMVVRGAPAIGISAAYGMALAAAQSSEADWEQELHNARSTLAASRPTAVNLFWALKRCDETIAANTDRPQLADALLRLAIAIHREDIDINKRIGDHGARLLSEQSLVYTHCNAGALATGGYGTALGVIRSAHRDGRLRGVIAGETRPWLQGARLTSWELLQDAIPVTLAIEGAAAQLMREQQPDWLIVGADRIAADGGVANKIGTYNLAIIARHHGVKVMVAAPTSTFDLDIAADDIPIEQRPAQEITHSQGKLIAAADCPVLNPAFDVTPASLIDAIVTEFGVISSPDTAAIRSHFEAAGLLPQGR